MWDLTLWYLMQELQAKKTAKSRGELWVSASPRECWVSWPGHSKWQYNHPAPPPSPVLPGPSLEVEKAKPCVVMTPPCKMRSWECAEVTVNKQLQVFAPFYTTSSSSPSSPILTSRTDLNYSTPPPLTTLGTRPPPSRKVSKDLGNIFTARRWQYGQGVYLNKIFSDNRSTFWSFYYFIRHLQMPSTVLGTFYKYFPPKTLLSQVVERKSFVLCLVLNRNLMRTRKRWL